MEFGHVDESLTKIVTSLPPDTACTKKSLKNANYKGELSVYVGAPKWSQKTWLGNLYPPRTRDSEFLNIYSQNFNTVEFGPTFYNIYTADEIARWTNQIAGAPEFKFYPKFSQVITHMRRLSRAEDQTAQFYQSLAGFGNHLGPLLLQLGDGFTPKSFPQLKAYLESLPPTIKVSVEVRHKEWFANQFDRNNLFQLLSDLNIGTVITDSPGRRDCAHMELTTNEATIRFVGNNLAESDYKRLDNWGKRLKIWQKKGLKTIWFFMHQHDEKFIPDACDYFIKQLNEKLGTNIARPHLLDK